MCVRKASEIKQEVCVQEYKAKWQGYGAMKLVCHITCKTLHQPLNKTRNN